MDSTTASIARSGADTAHELSLVRLYVLRATYLLLVVGLGATIVPVLFSHEPMARGAIPSLLGAVWLLAFVGLRYPLQMLPLLMRIRVEGDLADRFRSAAMVRGTASADLCRRLQSHCGRCHPDADRDPVGLRLSPLRQTAGEPLAVIGALMAVVCTCPVLAEVGPVRVSCQRENSPFAPRNWREAGGSAHGRNHDCIEASL
jgi:hypothetical protein